MRVVTNILFKQIAVDLINMHQARGDQIYFVPAVQQAIKMV